MLRRGMSINPLSITLADARDLAGVDQQGFVIDLCRGHDGKQYGAGFALGVFGDGRFEVEGAVGGGRGVFWSRVDS